MIAVFETYHIDKIEAYDTHKIHELLSSNYEHFEAACPDMLAKNLTEELSNSFVKKKIGQFKNKEAFLFTIKKTITGDIIGIIYIKNLDWEAKQGECICCVDYNLQGKGIATKAIKALSHYAFKTLTLESLIANIHKTNIASIKSVTNNGFTWTGTLNNGLKPTHNPPLDMELYTLQNER